MDELVSNPVGTGITPQMPTEPPQEVKDMTFTLDPELLNSGGQITITDSRGAEIKETDAAKTADATPKKDEKVVEFKKKEEAPKKEEKKSPILKPPTEDKITAKTDERPVVKPITPVKEKKEDVDTTDYSKYSPQDVRNLKRMDNSAKADYIRLIEENRQLATLKDANYLQHEQGYTLSPEYRQLTQKNQLAKVEGQVWKKCLLDIKAGKPIREIEGFDQNGNPVLGAEKQATDDDELRISNNFNACIGAVRQLEIETHNFGNQFKQRITQDLTTIRDTQKQLFAWHTDPKLLDYKLDIEGQGEKTLSQIKQDVRSMLPSYYQNNPLADVLGDMMIALRISQGEAREAKNGQQVAQIKQQEIQRAEPTSDSSPAQQGASKKGIPSVFSLENSPINFR